MLQARNKLIQKRCFICSRSFSKAMGPASTCACGIRVHEVCAVDEVHCPKCDRNLILITDSEETLGG